MNINYVTIKKFSELTGYSEHAIRANIKLKKWLENEIWFKREGRILLSITGYNRWAETEKVLKPRRKHQLKSRSNMKESNVENELSLSPPPLI